MTAWPRGLFVVGTDTDVGKTWVAATLARAWVQAGYRVGVIKPVSTGGTVRDGQLRSTDADALIAAISAPGSPFPPPPHDRVAPLIYPLPLAPVVAARAAETPLTPATLIEAVRGAVEWWVDEAEVDLLIVEGVGGLLCPVAEAGWTVADLAVHLGYPVLIVARRGLGTLNHTLLTVEAARSRALTVAGIVLNGAQPTVDPRAEATNAATLAAYLPTTPILAEWAFGAADTDPPVLAATSWISLAEVPRASPDQAHFDQAPGARADPLADLACSSESDIEVIIPARSVLDSSSSGEIRSRPVATDLVARSPTSSPSATSFAGLDLDLDRSPAGRPRADRDEDGSDDEPRPAPSRGRVVLASYASAVTLALAWLVVRGRDPRAGGPIDPTPRAAVVSGIDGDGRPGSRSRRVELPEAIPPAQMIDLGQSRQVGSLLIRPIGVERRSLTLERIDLLGKPAKRDGGRRAIVLKVQLQNLAKDEIFAPVDPSFVRSGTDNESETYFELATGRKLYPGPLAVQSEWSLIGQSFAVLRPGESSETIFTTEPNAPVDAERSAGTWRIKLRTGVDSIALIGVRIPDRTEP